MRVEVGGDGVTSVFLGDAVALFADRSATPPGGGAEELAAAAAARLALVSSMDVPVLYARQVHGGISFVYGAEGPLAAEPRQVGACDALITAESRVGLTIRTADCLPVALAGERVAALVHAGWRGLAADILGAVVRRLGNEFGVPGTALRAAIGVGIGPCHYTVGREVRDALARLPVARDDWNHPETIDLQAFARGRLEALGIPACAVLGLEGCTYCDGRHHSFRRDGDASGRQWSAVMLLPDRSA